MQWAIFKRQREKIESITAVQESGTTQTRQFWMVPLIGILGYQLSSMRKAEVVNEKTYGDAFLLYYFFPYYTFDLENTLIFFLIFIGHIADDA